MADVAGIVLGVVALWKTCVQVFETIEATEKYGMDYEILSVKLEVERIRLLNWGEAVGFGDDPQSTGPHPDLAKEHVRLTVTRVLGCIKSTFEGTDLLQTKYGLEAGTTPTDEATGAAHRLMLDSVFRESYERVRAHARDRQKGTTLGRRTVWAIKDKTKFRNMIVEIRGFNDSLETLFRGVRESTEIRMVQDISSSDSTAGLQLIQDAMAGEHQILSDQASARIEVLTAAQSSTARTELLSAELDTVSLEEEPVQEDAAWEDVNEDEADAKSDTTKLPPPREKSEWENRAAKVDTYAKRKRKGTLIVSLHGPHEYSSRVSTSCGWEGENYEEDSPWTTRSHGHVSLKHSAFKAYWKKRYMTMAGRKRMDYDYHTEEGSVLFDVESYQHFENIHPGTVTVEGFALEAWSYEENHHPKGDKTIFVSCADPGPIEGKQLLRRVHELQTSLPKWGWATEEDRESLIEFMGDGDMYARGDYDRGFYFSKFFSWLNRRDVFVDFLQTSSVGAEWTSNGISSFWNLLWQVIVGYELLRRLNNKTDRDDGYTFGFTARVLGTVIISDAFINNVRLVLSDMKLKPADIKKPDSPEDAARAEKFKAQGNEAMARKDYEKAVHLYTEAIRIDSSNAVYRCNRSAASNSQEKYENAIEDAYLSTRLDPKYAKAWTRLGAACLKTGRIKTAEDAYKRAGQLQSGANQQVVQQGLTQAKEEAERQIAAIDKEADKSKQHRLRKDLISQEWDTLMMLKSIDLHSNVHEQQVEGMLYFAELIKWPFINETREFAEEAYGDLRGGKTLPIDLHDWLFGLVLPGKWFAFKIMSALVLCTPSLSSSLGVAPYFDCGLATPTKSYWRSRTVLGRVLGCLPGVQSLCGWLGPCPPVEFDPPPEDGRACRHVRLKYRQVTPVGGEKSDVIELGGGLWRDTQLGKDEELSHWIEEMTDPDNWLIPEPPVKDISTCTLKTIRLKRDMSSSEAEDDEQKAIYRAQLFFRMDDSTELIRFSLFTNPLFITLPPCHVGPKGAHELHLRELHRYDHRHVWSVGQLKGHTAESSEGSEVVIINATGAGSELLARAWCSERGKNAVIRNVGGPCYTCTVRAAGEKGLRTGVVIWVSSDWA
ncbi:hypothetical protein NLU13_8067 [Sarocladium strictum]|uniref:Prion-inhibition and propagation HeLo domain-containing protein n=1 Tax=Sarocladium strictum TaxID=5046 RepID=A0AA39GAY7_SARSR|nr:hypothetical protein NLU13_8067 [Sarocladium strictum]